MQIKKWQSLIDTIAHQFSILETHRYRIHRVEIDKKLHRLIKSYTHSTSAPKELWGARLIFINENNIIRTFSDPKIGLFTECAFDLSKPYKFKDNHNKICPFCLLIKQFRIIEG
jgi:hypothetical protein